MIFLPRDVLIHVILITASVFLLSCSNKSIPVPGHFTYVDQILWVVSDLNNVKSHWERLGFTQMIELDIAQVDMKISRKRIKIRLAKANLGGAHVNWIQPLDKTTLFADFQRKHGDGAMSIVHRLSGMTEIAKEVDRLANLGVAILEEIEITTGHGVLHYVLMDTRAEGKYILGYTYGEADLEIAKSLLPDNRHAIKLSQYAFAIRDADKVSDYWYKLGQPAFQISHPELGNPHYYGKPVDHELIQGWQKHGSIDYEWCIPVKPPIVYEDHIKKHGEGIHHLAFSVADMDKVLEDFTSLGYVNSMGGTWGEKGKPGSGWYEYIDMEDAGGVTLELLWSFQE